MTCIGSIDAQTPLQPGRQTRKILPLNLNSGGLREVPTKKTDCPKKAIRQRYRQLHAVHPHAAVSRHREVQAIPRVMSKPAEAWITQRTRVP